MFAHLLEAQRELKQAFRVNPDWRWRAFHIPTATDLGRHKGVAGWGRWCSMLCGSIGRVLTALLG